MPTKVPDNDLPDGIGKRPVSLGDAVPVDDLPQATQSASPKQDVTDWGGRLVQGYTDPFNGIAQLAARGLTALGLPPPVDIDAGVKNEERMYQERRGDNSGRFDGMRAVGNAINPINVAITSRIPVAGGLAARVAGGAAAGGATSALNPVLNGGDFASEKFKQAAVGGAFGAGVPLVTGGLARIISPKASVNPDLALLRGEGVRPTIGQTLGGFWNKAEEQLQSVPILGHSIAKARGSALQDFNNAAINRATAPIGVKIGGAGTDAIGKASNALGGAYEQSLNKIGNTTLGDAFTGVSNAAKAEVGTLPPIFQTRFNRLFDSPGNRLVSETGDISAKNAKAVMSDVAAEIRKFGKSSDVSTAHYVEQLERVHAALGDALKAQNSAYAQAVKSADRGWANLVRVEDAANRAVNNNGVFTPAQLNAAVKAGDFSVRRNAMAHGDALMQDLGVAGQNVLGNKVPDSGTASRLLWPLLVGGGAGAPFAPATAALVGGGLLGGAGLYTSPMQRLLTGAVTSRPEYAQPASELVKRFGNGLIPLLAAPQFVNNP